VELDRRSVAANARLFVESPATAQDAVLAAVEREAYALKPDGGDSFWRDLKYLTLYGYYTSRLGIEEELRTPPFPGRWDGCAVVGEAPR
jgi:hypothetical protein